MSYRKNVNVPELDHDAMMLARFGSTVHTRGRGERRAFAALCAHMKRKGWHPIAVWDGEVLEKCDGTAKSAMEFVFNLDEASVRFAPIAGGKNWHGVLIILGNSPEEIVSDWNYSEGDADGFNAAMEAFNAEEYL